MLNRIKSEGAAPDMRLADIGQEGPTGRARLTYEKRIRAAQP
jgi:hypothetical protein